MQNELYHHGIDGQRWGVRHGPPYPLDRADHNRVIEKSKKATEKRHLSYDKSRKYAKRMTDKDLNDTIDRLQREETYRRLVSKDKEDAKASKKAKAAQKEAKKIYKDRENQQKIQNEMEKKKQEDQKKANSITHKVIERLLTNAAGVAGTRIMTQVMNVRGDQEIADKLGKKKKEKYEKLKINIDYPVSENEPVIDFANMKFAGGDWNDGSETLDSRLIQLAYDRGYTS